MGTTEVAESPADCQGGQSALAAQVSAPNETDDMITCTELQLQVRTALNGKQR